MTNYLSRLAVRAAGSPPKADTLAPRFLPRRDLFSRENEEPFVDPDQPAFENPSKSGEVLRNDVPIPLKADQPAAIPSIPAYPPIHSPTTINAARRPVHTSSETIDSSSHLQPSIAYIAQEKITESSRGVMHAYEGKREHDLHEQGRLQKTDYEAAQAAPLSNQAESFSDSTQVSPVASLAGEAVNLITSNKSEPISLRPAQGVWLFHTDQTPAGIKGIEPFPREQKGDRDRAVAPRAELLPKQPEPVPAADAPMDQPKLTIGRLVVEVIPSEPAVMQPQPRRAISQTVKPPGASNTAINSKLRFGLGQI